MEKIVALYVYQGAAEGERSYKIYFYFVPLFHPAAILIFLLGVYSVKLQHLQKRFLSLGSKEKFFAGRETGFAFSKDV